ncbi:spondin domain-containing protein [uncultured Tateyamaria sp.]|uniref:spondin domain-containing protein n=1 Tax=uncultured Tateyamaria sp. TaxID=455651 RepID=UPI002608A6EB|nr:spondin domain-containing protein [uncultured Tateyamaria sp.]
MLRAQLICAACLWAHAAFAESDGATYRVEVSFDWSGQAGAGGHPSDAHWSRLIAVAHSARYALFADGQTASTGLALVATNGRVSVLEAELAETRRRGRAGVPVVVPGLETGVGTFVLDLALDPKLSQVSFATMLAPSPDWFSGASGVALLVDGAWVERLDVPLWVWDAGADHGPDFEGPNMDTQPRQSVRLLVHPAFLTARGMTPIGTATFTRLP